MKIALFDIDGTLLSTRGAGKRAMQTALVDHFGTSGPADYRYDGKTDKQIARDLMRASGFDDETIDARMRSVLTQYLQGLRDELTSPDVIKVHTGVAPLIEALCARTDVVVGLLTGNIEDGAHAKLAAAQLGPHRFRVGAFGSDDERRDALPAIAQARATQLLGTPVNGDALVIIGDTPNDIACGRGVRARAIAVATGHYSVDALSAHEPAAVFADLSDTPRVVEAIVRA
ncbi:MAG TPA: HAD family hydrolase [Gemmatimonadaceae bacterium]|nr:HAD family hydrolase [Gemmatimonadaceae bacterium]